MTTEPETWGFCPDCQRWFYCERAGGTTHATCPVCWGEPSMFDTTGEHHSERP